MSTVRNIVLKKYNRAVEILKIVTTFNTYKTQAI